MVQVGTALQKEGVAVFDRITKELKEIQSRIQKNILSKMITRPSFLIQTA